MPPTTVGSAYFGALVWLRHGVADLPAFRDAVQKMVPSETIVFQTQANTTAAVRRAVRPETVALVAFGLLAARPPSRSVR